MPSDTDSYHVFHFTTCDSVSKSKDRPKYRAFLHVAIRGFGVVDSYGFVTKAFWKLFNTASAPVVLNNQRANDLEV